MTTEKERWERVNKILAQALEQPTKDRQRWVAKACGNDVELRDEVLELLAFDAEKTGGIRTSIAAAASDLGYEEELPTTGRQVGAWQISRKIAEGGMGAVYLAERREGGFAQRAAIKLLARRMVDDESIRRFLEERRILATLEHPNIARLIDGGTLENGTPYIVMEYVDGVSIDQYCRDHSLDNAAVIRLFQQVCGAVDYAHRKLVIHRDIKPSNILVDKNGVPKLLDFGIAKLLESGDGNDIALTREDARILTPMYASPEQIVGLPITTAADVYGLGLLLYRLLTGHMPYTPTGQTPREIEHAVLSQPPERPSNAVTSNDEDRKPHPEHWIKRQRKALQGDLDTILLMALRKEPERRYASVSVMAEDLGRYLDKRPILARGDSIGYTTARFLQRHSLPVSIAAVMLSLAIGLTVYYTKELQVERDTAEQTAEFLADLFESGNPSQRNRKDLTLDKIVDSGAEKLIADPSLEPEVRARLLTTLANVYRNIGEIDKADELATQALELLQSNNGSDRSTIDALGTMSDIRRKQGQYEDALSYARQMHDLAAGSVGAVSQETAAATHKLSILSYDTGDLESMGRWAWDSYKIRQQLYGKHDVAMLISTNNLGLYYWQIDDLERASEFYARSAEIQNAQAERNDVRYANTLHNLGLLYNDSGRYEAARKTYEESIAVRLAATKPGDPVIPLTYYALSHTLEQLGDLVGAHETLSKQYDLQVAVAGPRTDMVAYSLTGHGALLLRMGNKEQARKKLLEANEIYAETHPDDHPYRLTNAVSRGYLALDDGELDTAEQIMRQALEGRRQKEGADNFSTLRTHTAIARVLFAKEEYDLAASELVAALDAFAANDGAEHPFAIEAHSWLGRVELARGNADKAVRILDEALKMGEAKYASGHIDNVERRLWLAEALAANGETEKSLALQQQAEAERDSLQLSWQASLDQV